MAEIETPGRRLLAEREPNQSKVARALDVDPSTVSGWYRGVFRPEPPMRSKIRIRFGVAEDTWLTEAERKELEDFAEKEGETKPKKTRKARAA